MKMLFVGDLHLGSRSEQVEEAAREKILQRAEEADSSFYYTSVQMDISNIISFCMEVCNTFLREISGKIKESMG